MPDLKHQTPAQLLETIAQQERYIDSLRNQAIEIENRMKPFRDQLQKLNIQKGGAEEKVRWAKYYYESKVSTPMTKEQIEQALGFKISIVD